MGDVVGKVHVESKKKAAIEETMLTAMEDKCMFNNNKFTSNTWIGDTGAMSHMTNSDKGITNVKIIHEEIKMGNGQYMTAMKKSILLSTIKQANGNDVNCSLEVKIIPEIWCNICSFTAAMKKGFKFSSKGMEVKVKKGTFKFTFNKIGQTTSGVS